MQKTILTSVALAGLLGLGAAIGMTNTASAEIVQHRCSADGCWSVRCDNDGDYCQRVWDEDRYYRRHYSTTGYIDRGNGYYVGNQWRANDQDHRRSWMCDADGDNCHWVYESF
ncbi:MAG TPA: hypothetical protein VGH02_06880 [Rhizomicrobium sp.]